MAPVGIPVVQPTNFTGLDTLGGEEKYVWQAVEVEDNFEFQV